MKNSILFFVLCGFICGCTKSSEDISLTLINDYAPLKVGKYITYSLDSLVFVASSTQEAHRQYEVKYLVQDSITDNLGRKAFRIVRYIRTLPNGIFNPENTFVALNSGTGFEFTENNIKFLKLTQPIKDDASWKGNAYVDISSSANQYLIDWDYTYTNVAKPSPIALSGFPAITNTITVNQRNHTFNLPIIPPVQPNPTFIANKDSAVEIYAKDIGLVYKKFLHWEYQYQPNGGSNATYIGSGVTMILKDYN